MDRRSFLSLGSLPIASALLAACGGGSSSDADLDEIIYDEGVDPATLSSVPDEFSVDTGFLLEQTAATVSASVVLGSEGVPGVEVNFYDAVGHLIGTAVTDKAGFVETDIPARRLVVAQARTPHGELLGMRLYSGLELMPVLHVDILQTVFVKVITNMVGRYNVSMYVLQDYFRVPHNMNVLNIGHDEPLLNQKLVHAEWLQTGSFLENYTENLAADIIDHIDDDSYANLRFNSRLADDSLQTPGLQFTEEDIVRKAGGFAVDLIAKAIPLPFAAPILKFGFDQFLGKRYPGEPDPFIEVRKRLQDIEAKLETIEKLIKEMHWREARERIASHFSVFVNVFKTLKDLGETDPDQNQSGTYLFEKYETDLLALTDDGVAENNLHTAKRLFFGQEEFRSASGIDKLISVIQSNKFYSGNSEELFRNYLAYFSYYQGLGYTLLACSYIVRIKNGKEPEEKAKSYLEYLNRELAKTNEAILAVDVAPLPERVNIDHANKVAWIGSCGLIKTIEEFWPSDRWKCLEMIQRFDDDICIRGAYGEGLSGWKGPNVARQMARKDAYVSNAILEFGDWRSPSEQEFRLSFFDKAKSSSKKVNVYAAENGFSCFSRLANMELMAFSDYPANTGKSQRLSKIPTRYRRAGSAGRDGAYYYLDCTGFDLETNKSGSNDVRYRYNQFSRVTPPRYDPYIFFPACSVDDGKMARYLPWLTVQAARQKGKI